MLVIQHMESKYGVAGDFYRNCIDVGIVAPLGGITSHRPVGGLTFQTPVRHGNLPAIRPRQTPLNYPSASGFIHMDTDPYLNEGLIRHSVAFRRGGDSADSSIGTTLYSSARRSAWASVMSELPATGNLAIGDFDLIKSKLKSYLMDNKVEFIAALTNQLSNHNIVERAFIDYVWLDQGDVLRSTMLLKLKENVRIIDTGGTFLNDTALTDASTYHLVSHAMCNKSSGPVTIPGWSASREGTFTCMTGVIHEQPGSELQQFEDSVKMAMRLLSGAAV